MTYGFLSDVHGDLDALERALELLARADQRYFLGDAIGGARDRECVDRLRESDVLSVPGNHDLWEFELFGLRASQIEFLRRLPMERSASDFLAVHSDYEEDSGRLSFPYIHSEDDARRALSRFPQRLVFFGHTHLNQLHEQHADGRLSFVRACPERTGWSRDLEPCSRYLINVGEVQDCVVLYDDALGRVTFLDPSA